MPTYRKTTGTSTEPLTYSEVKDWLRLNDDTEQTLVTTLITVAREIVEGQTWRPVTEQVYRMYFDKSELDTMVTLINKAPLISIDSVKYYDVNDVEQTLAATEYEYDLYANPARFRLKSVPSCYDKMNTLYIEFTCGYTTIPEDLKQAFRMIIGHLYENRQDVVTGTQVNEIPMASKYILERYRNNFIFAKN